jgi:hypothetical protein
MNKIIFMLTNVTKFKVVIVLCEVLCSAEISEAENMVADSRNVLDGSLKGAGFGVFYQFMPFLGFLSMVVDDSGNVLDGSLKGDRLGVFCKT